jgi:hypothetical protein
MAYWNWSFLNNKIENYNLITITSNDSGGIGKIQTTKYFIFLKMRILIFMANSYLYIKVISIRITYC